MATKGKSKTTKKKGSGSTTRVSQAKKTAKKPASFSKAPQKKTKETKKVTEKVTKKASEKFSEFETLSLQMPEKTHSKIVVRDVEKEDKKLETEQSKIEITLPEKKVAKKEEPKKIPINTAPQKLTAKEIKEQEISKAIKAADKVLPEKPAKKKAFFGNFGLARAILVIACASTIAFSLVYFINLASNDMSIKVAAMQSGIDANYPSYIPRGYSITDVSSSNGKIVMRFKKDTEEFEIVEENSNWDSDALLNNYIREKYGDDYTMVREQGLTLFMGDSWEAWVNGGILYKLAVNSGSLTKKQMRTIAASL